MAMVVPEHPAQPLAALDRISSGVGAKIFLDQLVSKALVVPFGVIVLDVLAKRPPQ